MRYILLAYVFAACIGVYVWSILPKHEPPTPPIGVNSQLWNRGRVLYQTRCISCHNSNPDFPGSIGPKLRGVSEELLTERLKSGKNGMPAQPSMLKFVPALREYLK